MLNTLEARSVDSWASAAASLARDDLQAMQVLASARNRAMLCAQLAVQPMAEQEIRANAKAHRLTALEEGWIRLQRGM